jgi:redox-sensing transcriptional repressor
MMAIPGPAKERLLHIMRLLEENGGNPMTSAEAEALTGWSSYTIRKDISWLGGDCGNDIEGKTAAQMGSSAGYAPETLIPAIKKALGLDRRRRFCVVGLGRLGSAFLNFESFDREGAAAGSAGVSPLTMGEADQVPADLGLFELIAGFDSNVNRVEILKSPVPLYPAYQMPEVISRFSIEMAILCVPTGAAQTTAEKLASAGIRGILNFAPAALKLPPEVTVRNVYVADELRALAIGMNDA